MSICWWASHAFSLVYIRSGGDVAFGVGLPSVLPALHKGGEVVFLVGLPRVFAGLQKDAGRC